MRTLQEGQGQFRDDVATRELLAVKDNATPLENVGSPMDPTERLARFECLVFTLFGERDAPISAGSRLLAGGMARSSTHSSPGVGHHPLVA
jgi:hypothetical protein